MNGARGLAAGILVAVVAAGCTATSDPPPPRAGAAAPATVEVSRRDITSVLVVPGTTTAQPEVLVAHPASGTLDQHVPVGDRVEAGRRIGAVGGTAVRATADGVLTAWNVGDGENVLGDVPLATVRSEGLAAQVPIPADLAYRVYSTPTQGVVSIEGGPAGIPCDVLPVAAPAGSDGDDGGSAAGPEFACLLPEGTRTMPGLPAKVGLQTAIVEGVLSLPVEAVLGSAQTGTVTRVDGGRRTVVTVDLGVSDGAVVEIVGGLEVGDVVEAVAPGLTAGPQ